MSFSYVPSLVMFQILFVPFSYRKKRDTKSSGMSCLKHEQSRFIKIGTKEPSLMRILFRFSHMVNSFLRPTKIIERDIWSFSVSYVFLIIKLASECAFLKLCVHFCFQKKPGGETEQQELTYPSLQVDDLGVWSDCS